jgi:hypothetical protein
MKSKITNIFTVALLVFTIYTLFIEDALKPMFFSDDKSINLVGLNYHSESDMQKLKKTIEDFYGYDCVITNPVNTEENQLVVDCGLVQQEFGNTTSFDYDGGDITIYVSNSDLVADGKNVKGVCYGNEIYIESDPENVKITVIHELAHSFGLEHCENQCIMNTYTLKNWNYSSDTPHFCESCKSKLPKKP